MRAAALGFVVLGSLSGCLSNSFYRTEFTPKLSHGAHAVSVLGVFKDGRMDFESWDALAPVLGAALAGKCEAGYGSRFLADHGSLASAVDDVTRSDGLTDDLLAELAPAAQGDLVAVFTVAGHVEKAKIDIRDSSAGGGGGGMGGGGAAAGRIPMAHRGKVGPQSTAALDLVATLFSVRDHATVGVVELEYTGESADDALRGFAAKLREAIPGSTCGGWNWSVPIDEHRVRDLVER